MGCCRSWTDRQALSHGLNVSRLSLRRTSITSEGVEKEEHETVARVAGMGLINAENITGVPCVLEHLLTILPAMYRICVFVTVR